MRRPSLLIFTFETDDSIDCLRFFSVGIIYHWLPITLILSFFRYFWRATAFYLSLIVLLVALSPLVYLMATAREGLASVFI